MTRLSVNINKVALLRNARGGNLPDLVQVAKDIESFGAEGITVHPRPDQRHIRYDDLPALREIVTTEFNIEGNPTREFLDLVLAYPPHQCTLVPDAPDQLTSDAGWDTMRQQARLREVVDELHRHSIRVSVFVDPVAAMVEGAKAAGAAGWSFTPGRMPTIFPKTRQRRWRRTRRQPRSQIKLASASTLVTT